MSRIIIVVIIYHHHNPTDSVKLLDSQRRRNVFLVRYGQIYRIQLSFKWKTGRWLMSRIVLIVLIYHRHKAIDLIYIYKTIDLQTHQLDA
jgi:hypothetical protein